MLQSFTPSTDLGFLEATETGLKVTYVMSLFGSIVSVLVGIVASVCYSGILALDPLDGSSRTLDKLITVNIPVGKN